MKIVEINIEDIDSAPFNPASRTSPESRALKELAQSLTDEGQKVPIQVIKCGSRYALVDGHRRVAACRMLDRKKIFAIVNPSETVAARLFAIINGEIHSMNSLQWMEFWMKCNGKAPELYMPNSVVRDIKRCVELIGIEGLSMMLKRRISPSIVQWSTKLRNAIMQYSETPARGKRGAYRHPSAERCLRWIVKHDGAPHAVKALATVHSKGVCEKLSSRIFADKPLTVAELIPKPRISE